MRRALTFLVVVVGTVAGSLWWLHEGDQARAAQSVESGVEYLQEAEVPW